MKINENVVLGLDIGIGSIGWAFVEHGEEGVNANIRYFSRKAEASQPAFGVRTFDIPENPKTKELLNKHRQTVRRQRITIRRRAKRMREVRSLLSEHGLCCSDEPPLSSPWELRVCALDRLLTKQELATVLVHIAKHRGFRSNSKADKASASASETGKMLKAVSALQDAISEASCRTVGEYMARQPRKRNRSGPDGKPVYENTLLRSLLEDETKIIFQQQQRLGSEHAAESLLTSFLDIAFTQNPLKSWEDSVGYCVFEEDQKRAPALAYTSERFRLAQRLVNLRLRMPDGSEERISPEKIRKVVGQVGRWKGCTFAKLKQIIGVDQVRIAGLDYGRKNKKGEFVDPEKRDVCGLSAGCAQGTYTLAKILDYEGVQSLARRTTDNGILLIDAVATALTLHDDMQKIEALLQNMPLQAREQRALVQALHNGELAVFRRFAKLSLKAMQHILPEMIASGAYDLGCEMVGYNHAKTRTLDIASIKNPVVLRIMSEVRRQFKTIVNELGEVPGKVHIELLRDVGKSVAERNEIEKGLDRRREEKWRNKEKFAKLVNKSPDQVSKTELLRYELWREQGERCAYYHLWCNNGGERIYTGNKGMIAVHELQDGPNAAQIDHILPRSRTFDNRFINLCLVRVEANQAKGNRTPWEWIGREHPDAWHVYEEWIRSLQIKGFKKRNYLLKDLSEDVESRFHERNKHDASYAARLVMRWIEMEYERLGVPMTGDDGKRIRRVFARPGKITSDLRKAWGVEDLKKDTKGKRLGDRHHALDALVVALCTESMLQKITRVYKSMEQWQEKYRIVPHLPAPWEPFRHDVQKALQSVFVSRAERGKERGRLHEDTLRQIRKEINDQGREIEVLYERKPVLNLLAGDLENLKDMERNRWLRDILQDWIDRGKPKNDLPRSPQGDLIRRVRIKRGPFTSGITVPRGEGVAQADNAVIVRTDVYCKNMNYYLVPVYANRVHLSAPPRLAIIIGKNEREWLEMDESYSFCFSLIKNSYILAEKANGTIVEGYFSGTDRSVAAIVVAMAHDHQQTTKIGVKKLKNFQKYRVDRLGRLHRVKKETLSWHGAAYT